MVQMATDTARRAQEVAQSMMETAHKAQDLFSINNDDDDVWDVLRQNYLYIFECYTKVSACPTVDF